MTAQAKEVDEQGCVHTWKHKYKHITDRYVAQDQGDKMDFLTQHGRLQGEARHGARFPLLLLLLLLLAFCYVCLSHSSAEPN